MRRVALVLMASLTASTSAAAHDIHSTHTTVAMDAQGYVLTVRAFADDLSASVARFHKRAPPADSSVKVDEVVAYASVAMGLPPARGAASLRLCGITRVRDAYILCFCVANTTASAPLRLGNQLLTELHADQVNIVQCAIGTSRRSTLFTNGRPPVLIAEHKRCR